MTNIFLKISIAIIAAFSVQLHAYSPTYATEQSTDAKFESYPNELKVVVQMMMRIPEVKQLLAAVQQNGPVKIKIARGRQDEFVGYWDGAERAIVIDGKVLHDTGKVISTIIFEIHNAQSNYRFDHLNDMASNNNIDKDNFVRETERVEHQNLLNCSTLLNACVNSGKLPQTARMPVIRDFEKHYQVQQLNGHSGFLAWCYDEFNPKTKGTYHGTIPGIDSMSEQQKDRLANQLVSENLEYPS